MTLSRNETMRILNSYSKLTLRELLTGVLMENIAIETLRQSVADDYAKRQLEARERCRAETYADQQLARVADYLSRMAVALEDLDRGREV